MIACFVVSQAEVLHKRGLQTSSVRSRELPEVAWWLD
jgi:hypothetical protein